MRFLNTRHEIRRPLPYINRYRQRHGFIDIRTQSKCLGTDKWMPNCYYCAIGILCDVTLLTSLDHDHLRLTIVLDVDQTKEVCNLHNFPVYSHGSQHRAVLLRTSLSL
jgi:hypothetical protein